jgi:hypothetical protein
MVASAAWMRTATASGVSGSGSLILLPPENLTSKHVSGYPRGRSRAQRGRIYDMPTPEELIREVAPVWRWGGRGPITDPIDMVFKLSDQVQGQVTVVRLETAAALYRALAEGFGRAAQIIAGSQPGG